MIDFVATRQEIYNSVQIFTSDNQHFTDLARFCKGGHKFAPFVGACLLWASNEEVSIAEPQARIAPPKKMEQALDVSCSVRLSAPRS